MEEKKDLKTQLLYLLRLESTLISKWTFGGALIGILAYFVFSSVKLPEYTFTGLDLGITVIPVKGGIDLGLVVISISAAYCGPLAGFLVGFVGSLGADFLYTQQIVAFGSVNFAFGILGFIIGIPRYMKEDGFADGNKIALLILFSFIGYLSMTFLYLIGLMLIAGQSLEGTLLYNFAPNFSIILISLLLFAPVIARIGEILMIEGLKIWDSKIKTR
ncbi:MAG: ECF transporter S component [Candidatus Heimdallarchaeota archaeon]|nr:MAG: ECF transporter S component [Candidatus Heimdallarchaeota archaeon]